MAGRTLANATKPYFTTKGAQGTGLGLYQARRFCEAMGGRLKIQSATGLGTAVHLLLPYAASERRALPDMAQITLPSGTHETIDHHIAGRQ
jgi:signal transduction histidine kinase